MKPLRIFGVLVVAFLLSASPKQAQMSAHYINVGQAESILLEFKTAAILIDAGGELQGTTAIEITYSPTLTHFSQGGPISETLLARALSTA